MKQRISVFLLGIALFSGVVSLNRILASMKASRAHWLACVSVGVSLEQIAAPLQKYPDEVKRNG